MKKIIALVLTFAFALSFTACGGNAPAASSSVPENSTVAAETKTISENEVISAAEHLYIQLNEAAVKNDYSAFAGLFTNTEDSVIQNLYNNMNIRSNYDQHFTVVVCQTDGYYRIGHTDAVASGRYPDTSVSRAWFDCIIVNTKDGWKYDFSDDAVDLMEDAYMATYPQGMQDAVAAGRNATTFNTGNYMHLNTSLYIDAIFDANVMTMWQDAEGNLCVGVLFNNGTDGNRTAKSIKLKITDNSLGTVFEGDLGSETVLQGSSKYTVFTVPAAQVKTGTAMWGYMSYSLNTQNV